MQKAGGFIYNVTAEVLSRVYYSVLLVMTIKALGVDLMLTCAQSFNNDSTVKTHLVLTCYCYEAK